MGWLATPYGKNGVASQLLFYLFFFLKKKKLIILYYFIIGGTYGRIMAFE